MSYVTRNLVPGETLLFETRHHWIVLLGPMLISLLLALPGVALLAGAISARSGQGVLAVSSPISPEGMGAIGVILLMVALTTFGYLGGAKQRISKKPLRINADGNLEIRRAWTGYQAALGIPGLPSWGGERFACLL